MGSAQATSVRSYYPDQTVLAIAAQLNATKTMASMHLNDNVLPAIKALGAYPFTKDFTLGCGGIELGSRLDVSQAPLLPAGPGHGKSGGYVESGPVAGDAVARGWALINDRGPDCVLVINDHGIVVGGGAVGLRRGDVAAAMHSNVFENGWEAVAAPNATNPPVSRTVSPWRRSSESRERVTTRSLNHRSSTATVGPSAQWPRYADVKRRFVRCPGKRSCSSSTAS
jgi:hypothetical protein